MKQTKKYETSKIKKAFYMKLLGPDLGRFIELKRYKLFVDLIMLV